MKAWVIANIEIVGGILTPAIVNGVALFITDSDADVWIVSAVVSVILGLANALIIWFIRHRQRAVRRAAIQDIREMLKDTATNTLSVISLNAQLSRSIEAKRRDRITASVTKIDHVLNELSEESLQAWHKYHSGETN